MTSKRSSERLQSILLNLPIIILFASAWVSDKWPRLMVPALAVAVGAAAIELAVIVVLAKRKKSDGHATEEVVEVAPIVEVAPVVQLSKTLASAEFELFHLSTHAVWSTKKVESTLKALQIAHSRDVVLWLDAVKSTQELQAKRHALSRRAALPDHWEVRPQGRHSFTIDAGAFEIEHFGGQTNIRIHDSSRVSVEGSERGAPAPGMPPELKPARYN